MPELLLFKWDHATQSTPTPSVSQLAALPKTFDLIASCPDGHAWGVRELIDPWFRIIAWPQAVLDDLETLLSGLKPQVDSQGHPMTLEQYRGQYLNGADTDLATVIGTAINDSDGSPLSIALAQWWEDDTRASPVFAVPTGATFTVDGLKLARPAVPDPAYTGPG